ncbi:hypothetical protein [Halomonas caseinilytica]|uniref:hypothetical protein n=1 Tax=Halomonas caseinilytica TaxID=438744 RepID=UPI00147AD091|nr:hypothetical protein [Halomonas caseinilytica]
MPQPHTYPPRTLAPEQIVERLRQRPYDRAAREAADLIERLLADRTREIRH